MTGSKQGTLRSVLGSLVAAGVMAAAGVAVTGLSCLLGYLGGLALVPGFMAIVLGTGLIIAGLVEGGRRGIPGLEEDAVVYAFITTMIAAMLGFIMGGPLVEHRRVSWGEQRDVTVADAASHSGATLLRLREGGLDTRTVFTRTHIHSGKNTAWYEHALVPVLPAGWRPGEPVRVWAVCEDFDEAGKQECLDAWRAASAWGVVIAPRELPCYERTLPTQYAPPDGRVVFVRWTESPETYKRALEAEAFSMVRGFGITWCVLSGLYWVFTSRARWRRENG